MRANDPWGFVCAEASVARPLGFGALPSDGADSDREGAGKWIAETSAERALVQEVLAAAVGRPGPRTVSPAKDAAALWATSGPPAASTA